MKRRNNKYFLYFKSCNSSRKMREYKIPTTSRKYTAYATKKTKFKSTSVKFCSHLTFFTLRWKYNRDEIFNFLFLQIECILCLTLRRKTIYQLKSTFTILFIKVWEIISLYHKYPSAWKVFLLISPAILHWWSLFTDWMNILSYYFLIFDNLHWGRRFNERKL